MTRRPSLSEMLWPDDPADADLPIQWAKDISTQVFDWVWRGYEEMCVKYLAQVDWAESPEQLERNLTELHFYEVQMLWKRETDGFPSMQPGPELPEMMRRKNPSSKPPAYDLGFVHCENRLWKLPVEAKVLPTSNALAEYLKDVREKFVGGIAAPFVGDGGMVGYLVKGTSEEVFDNLVAELNQPLLPFTDFEARPHRISTHPRNNSPTLRLHHMIMKLVSS